MADEAEGPGKMQSRSVHRTLKHYLILARFCRAVLPFSHEKHEMSVRTFEVCVIYLLERRGTAFYDTAVISSWLECYVPPAPKFDVVQASF